MLNLIRVFAQLNSSDTDLGSSAPALLGAGRVAVAGKDGVLRVLALAHLDGQPPGSAGARSHPLGGEVQRSSTPGGGELFSAPAVWRHGSHTTLFIADGSGTTAYASRAGNLEPEGNANDHSLTGSLELFSVA
jgi:hypothetical protein